MLVVTSLSMNRYVHPLTNLEILFEINDLDTNVHISSFNLKDIFPYETD